MKSTEFGRKLYFETQTENEKKSSPTMFTGLLYNQPMIKLKMLLKDSTI